MMPRRGRPRDGRVDKAIMAATRQLLAEAGYAGLTMDAVAARAGISKAAIYRRHGSKPEMVLAATVHGRTLPPPPDSGSLLGELTALAEEIVGHLAGPEDCRALIGLPAELDADPALVAKFEAAFVRPQLARLAELLDRAVRRGELDPRHDVELVHAVLGGTVLTWLLVARRDPADLPARLARLTSAALRPAPTSETESAV